jgi:hypothetical protein
VQKWLETSVRDKSVCDSVKQEFEQFKFENTVREAGVMDKERQYQAKISELEFGLSNNS